jgi:hypothetical protein
LYTEVKLALQTGQLAPGERIDPAKLAEAFHTSPPPVRFALYRLVGEGIIEDFAREGFHVPRTTEVALRDLYGWMEHLLVTACDVNPPLKKPTGPPEPFAEQNDLVARTAMLFEAIASNTQSASIHRAVQRANDKLNPIRRAKVGMIDYTSEELRHMQELWCQCNLALLKVAIIDYHARRKRLVPHIVEALNSASSPHSTGALHRGT